MLPPEAALSEKKPQGTDQTDIATETNSSSTSFSPHGSELDEFDASHDDIELIAKAEVLYKEEKILQAARLLLEVQDKSLLESKHMDMLGLAQDFEKTVAELTGPVDEGSDWTKQGETHGKRPTFIYYKLDEYNRLTSRIETPIEASLLVPLLSVFSESDLFQYWIPPYKVPKLGIQKSKKLSTSGRANQTIQLLVDVPWPLYTREAIINAVVADEIDDRGYICVKLSSLDSGPSVPPPDPNLERVDFDGAILFRSCPPDHELLAHQQVETEEPLVLVCFKVQINSHMPLVPLSLINFITRHVIGKLWGHMLWIAEGVRDGSRLQHKEAIEANPEMYRWIEQRADFMLAQMRKETTTTSTMDDQEFISYLQS